MLASRLGYLYINTGAMYRAVGWKALRLGIALTESERIAELARNSKIELKGPPEELRVFVDGREVTEEIRAPEVSNAASIVSAIPGVRRALSAQQREMGRAGAVVMDGRDVGTHIFPDADFKFYIDASPEVRGRRRHREDLDRGVNTTLEETIADIIERDRRDCLREDSPLRRAPDAIYIDSSDMTVDQVVDRMLEIISQW